MEPQHNKVVDGHSVVSFSSGAKFPFFKLSNFYETPVHYLGTEFPCSEHAYQSQLFPDAIQLFQNGGILSVLSVEAFLYLGFKQKEAEKKYKYWSRKNMVGILSKMYATRQKKYKRKMDEQECKTTFLDILYAKYTQNNELFNILRNTKDSYLLEFDRGAERKWNKYQIKTRWAGMVVDNKVVGNNQQGVLHMLIRHKLNEQCK